MSIRAALIGFVFAPALLAAQTPAAPEAPLPLKHMSLLPNGQVWLSLGGMQRFREERDVNYLGGGTGTRTDNFGLSRTLINADLHLGSSFRLWLEGRHVTARGRDLPGGTRASDRDEFDWSTVYAEVSRRAGDIQSSLRVGRLDLTMGRERVVSGGDWSNVRRTWEGVSLSSVRGPSTLTAFYTHPVTVVQTGPNKADDHVAFWGVQTAWKRAKSPALLEIYLLDKDIDETTTAPHSERTTIGSRFITPIPGTHWTAEAEGGFQFGTTGTSKVRASMIVTDFTRAWTTRWTPSITFGADRSSGTHAGHGALSGTWDLLYALGHSYLGYADALGRRNIVEFRAVAQASPISTLRLRASGHAFRRASNDDGIYDTGGNVFRASVADAPAAVAHEFDVTASWRPSRFFKFDVGGARFSPGAFMRATGSAREYTWAFGSVTATY